MPELVTKLHGKINIPATQYQLFQPPANLLSIGKAILGVIEKAAPPPLQSAITTAKDVVRAAFTGKPQELIAPVAFLGAGLIPGGKVLTAIKPILPKVAPVIFQASKPLLKKIGVVAGVSAGLAVTPQVATYAVTGKLPPFSPHLAVVGAAVTTGAKLAGAKGALLAGVGTVASIAAVELKGKLPALPALPDIPTEVKKQLGLVEEKFTAAKETAESIARAEAQRLRVHAEKLQDALLKAKETAAAGVKEGFTQAYNTVEIIKTVGIPSIDMASIDELKKFLTEHKTALAAAGMAAAGSAVAIAAFKGTRGKAPSGIVKRKKKVKKARKRVSRKTKKGRKLKFGSKAWRKKYSGKMKRKKGHGSHRKGEIETKRKEKKALPFGTEKQFEKKGGHKVYHTKSGQPYIILGSGKARFIKR